MLRYLIKNKYVQFFVKFLLVILLLEFSLFNYYHWKSLNYESINGEDLSCEYGDGLSENSDGSYTIINPENAYIKITGIKKHVDNIFIDAENQTKGAVNIDLYADDAANKLRIKCGSTAIFNKVYKTNYINMNLSGNTRSMNINFLDYNATIFINDIIINKTVPFSISYIRVALEMACILMFMLFRPKSSLYSIKLLSDYKYKKILVSGFIIVQMIIIGLVGQVIDPNKNIQNSIDNDWPAYGQYAEVADAIINGQVYLERKPPASLANAKNPYDGSDRWQAVVVEGKETFDIDYAYFEGKYYSYFGVVPAILFYVPYQLIMGESLHTWDLVTLCSVLFCGAAFWFVYVLCKKYLKDVSLGMYLLLSQFLIYSSSIVYLVYLGIVYSVPIITGLLFGILGLGLWITVNKDGKLSKLRLFVGSLFIALIMGCRPQLVLIFLLAIPIFWDETLKDRIFFSKKGFANTTIIMLPFILIGLGIMLYNNLRFGSPFDFGANYNLTSNDMTHRGIEFERFPLGIMVYLFQPLTIMSKFPFMKSCDISNDYMGFTNTEPILGGMFAFSILMFLNLYIFKLKKNLKANKIYLFSILLLVISFIIMGLDIQMAGLTQRYLSDFAWLSAIVTVMMVISLEKHIIINHEKCIYIFRSSIFASVSLCIFLQLWSIFVSERYFPLYSCNPEVYYYLKTMLPFY